MSDLIAEAAANLGDTAPSSTEPPSVAAIGNVLLNEAPTVDAPNVVAPGVVASGASDVDQQPDGSVATASSQEVAELPRESHLMLLEAKLARFRAKLINAERVALDEFEAIVGHIRAIL